MNLKDYRILNNSKRKKERKRIFIMNVEESHGPLLFIVGIILGVIGVLFPIPLPLSFFAAALFFYIGIGMYYRSERDLSDKVSSVISVLTAAGALIGFGLSDGLAKLIFGGVFIYSLIAIFILKNEINS